MTRRKVTFVPFTCGYRAEAKKGSAANPSVNTDLVTDVKSEAAPSTSTSTPTSGEPSVAIPQLPEAPPVDAPQPSPMDVDKDKSSSESAPTPTPKLIPPQQSQPPQPPSDPLPAIDIAFEASKLPLDVAIFNSARAAGGDDKIRKYLQAVLVVGGTALIPGMAHALESRYVACTQRAS